MKIQSAVSASLAFIALAFVFGPSAAFAQEAPHEITWAHGSPAEVTRFVVYVSDVEGQFEGARQIDVGKPPAQPSNTPLTPFSAVIMVDPDDFIAVGAIGTNGVASQPSSWAGLPPSKPGQPLLLP